jgi:cold shock CspA family protein
VTGTVTEFDEHRGVGTIRAADGVAYSFHCTQILDGTRTIDEGATVDFEIRPGHLGQWEATAIAKA